MQLLQHENVECRHLFANNVLAILLQMKAFSIGSHKNGPKATKSRVVRRIAMGRGTFLGSVAPFLFSTAAGAPKPASTECAKSTKRVKAIIGGIVREVGKFQVPTIF